MTKLLIGIDPGVTTGFAVWDRTERRLATVESHGAIGAMSAVLELAREAEVEVWFEDARLRKWFGDADARQKRSGAGIREGVGSVKRECALWKEFCEFHGIAHRPIKPAAGTTKLDAARFNALTKWGGRTNEHARDAAMIVFGA